MSRLHAIAGGRYRVWWATQRSMDWATRLRDSTSALCLAGIIALYAGVSTLGYEDALHEARMAEAEALERAAEAEALAPFMSPVTFVLEARTEKELDLRLAQIAGSIDEIRARSRERTPAPGRRPAK